MSPQEHAPSAGYTDLTPLLEANPEFYYDRSGEKQTDIAVAMVRGLGETGLLNVTIELDRPEREVLSVTTDAGVTYWVKCTEPRRTDALAKSIVWAELMINGGLPVAPVEAGAITGTGFQFACHRGFPGEYESLQARIERCPQDFVEALRLIGTIARDMHNIPAPTGVGNFYDIDHRTTTSLGMIKSAMDSYELPMDARAVRWAVGFAMGSTLEYPQAVKLHSGEVEYLYTMYEIWEIYARWKDSFRDIVACHCDLNFPNLIIGEGTKIELAAIIDLDNTACFPRFTEFTRIISDVVAPRGLAALKDCIDSIGATYFADLSPEEARASTINLFYDAVLFRLFERMEAANSLERRAGYELAPENKAIVSEVSLLLHMTPFAFSILLTELEALASSASEESRQKARDESLRLKETYLRTYVSARSDYMTRTANQGNVQQKLNHDPASNAPSSVDYPGPMTKSA